MRQAEDFLEVGLVLLMGNDRGAFRDERSQPARMIEMAVGIDHVFDGFIRDIPLGLGDNRVGAFFALRSLNDHDVVLEIDGQRRVRRQDQVDAVRELLRSGGRRRRNARRIPLEIRGRVRRHVRNADIEYGEGAFSHLDCARKLDAAEILITAVGDLEERVAEHRCIHPRLHSIEHVLRIEVAVHLRFVGCRECHDGVFLPAHGFRCDRGVAIRSLPQKTMRGHPQVHLYGPRSVRANDDGLRRCGR